jgi:hypothetical protein
MRADEMLLDAMLVLMLRVCPLAALKPAKRTPRWRWTFCIWSLGRMCRPTWALGSLCDPCN